ncbi:hypothetical protein M422DRAFT_219170 [Sphaerobolus stellatus SS14]|nr:hypothetical protein M422DRAFT_219170 [Sphaerobolus stellatus SS14]
MSSPIQTFAVYAPDYADEGAPERRLKVREQHLLGIKGLKETNILQFGGVLLSQESVASPDAPRKMVGSMMVFRAESVAAVRVLIEQDVYWSGNVWDKERLTINPILIA